jgi:hypothetical protein
MSVSDDRLDELRRRHERTMLRLEERESSLGQSERDVQDAMGALRMAADAIEAADAAAFPEGNALVFQMSDEILRGVQRLGHAEEETQESLEHELRTVRSHMDAEEEAYMRAVRETDEGRGDWQ